MKIVVDHREMRSRVAEALGKLGADIEITALEVGDYVVSDSAARRANESGACWIKDC